MANEINVMNYPSGETLYAVVRNAAGNVWYVSGQVFEAWGTGGRDNDDYDISLTDKSGDMYVGNFDTNIPAGTYRTQIFLLEGSAVPDSDDTSIGSAKIVWSGSAERSEAEQAFIDYDPPTDTEMLAAHTTTDAEINANETKIDTLTTRLGTPANIDSGGATVADNLKKLADDNAGADFDATNDSLNKVRVRGDAAWITAISVTVSDKTGFSLSTAGILAVWHQLVAAVVTASTMGKLIIDYLNASISSRSPANEYDTQLDANMSTRAPANEYDTEMARIDQSLSTTESNIIVEIDANETKIDSLENISAADVNAQVDAALNTAIPGSPTANSVNERVKAIDDKLPTSLYLKGSADTDGGMDTADKADVNAQADSALTDYDPPTNTEMLAAHAITDAIADLIQTQTDKLDNMITEDSAGNEFTVAALANAPTAEMDATELAAAMKAITGITQGGTMTWQTLMQINSARAAGTWQLKTGETAVYELLDADDGATVVLEATLSQTTPFASISVLI